MNKKMLVAMIATGSIVVAGFVTAGAAFASEETFQPMMQRFAERLGVTTEVAQQAWDETHEEMQVERLDRAVENERITESQKAEIIAKQEEVKAALDKLRSQDPIDRDAIHDVMEETREWAEENDIPAGMVVGGGMMGRGGRGGMGGMREGQMGLNGDCGCVK